MIRIKDIADRAGVSPTTVSNVIHGKTGRVSKATVEKINRILKEMEYVPSISARMLANNSSGLIGVALGFMKKGNASSFEDPYRKKVNFFCHPILPRNRRKVNEGGMEIFLHIV